LKGYSVNGMTRGDEVWLATLRRLTPGQRFASLCEMWVFGFELRVAGVKLRFPALNDAEARRQAVAETVACHKKNLSRKSPLF
jgi:hypothetical protein